MAAYIHTSGVRRKKIRVFGQKYKGNWPFLTLFSQNICFGHKFPTDMVLQAIYILPVLRRDTHIDHIYGHIIISAK